MPKAELNPLVDILGNLLKMINCYWFESSSNTFHGPCSAHYNIKLPEEVLDIIIDDCGPTDNFYDVQFRLNWVRATYNTENKELNVNSIHSRHSFQCVKEFMKQGHGEVESLFLDINKQCVRGTISGLELDAYLKTGKIKLDQIQ